MLVFLMITIYRNRREKGAMPFLISLICLMIWAMATSFELISRSIESAIFWRNVTQIGMAFMPVFSLIFVMRYISYKGKLLWILVGFSFISNLIILPLTFTDSTHHLIRKSVGYVVDDGYYNLVVEPTLLGNSHVTFRFFLIFLVLLFLFQFQIKIFKSMRTQVLALGIGMLSTVLFLVIKHYCLASRTELLPMSLSFIILYSFIAISIFKFKFLKIDPLAKEWVINTLDEGIVVLSKYGKIIEVNPAAQAFLLEKLSIEPLSGMETLNDKNQLSLFNAVFDQILDCDRPMDGERDCIFQKSWIVNEEVKSYEFKMHYLLDAQKNKLGAVTVIRDVSQREREKNELIRRAETDIQTGIYNSRGFIAQFNQSQDDVGGLLIIDIDKFKQINDQFGHPLGDEVLKHIVSTIDFVVGDKAILGRLGGDEFGILLRVADHDECLKIARSVVKSIQLLPYELEHKMIKVSISLGGITNITLSKVTFDQIYPMADQLLYQSKRNGRNQYTLQKYDHLNKF